MTVSESRPSAWTISASVLLKAELGAHQAMCTRRIVDPNPIRAIVGQPVLAPVLVITTGARHSGGLLPAGSKAFCCACEALRCNKLCLRIQYEPPGTKIEADWYHGHKRLDFEENKKSKVIEGQDIL